MRHQRLARRGQISNFRVDIEFLKMTERYTVYASLYHLWIDLWRHILLHGIYINCFDMIKWIYNAGLQILDL